MAVLPNADDGFKLRSTVEPTDSSYVPDFGGGGRFVASSPMLTESENHKILLSRMMDKQLKPLADVKVLKGTVYSFKNRRIITRWIRDVCAAFGHKSTTFNLAVQLADCYLIAKLSDLAVTQCQLVALAAIWIAAKFEEMDPQVPALQALCDVCDRAYTKDQIVDMEEALLTYFKYCVPHTTAINFLHLYLHSLPAIVARKGDTSMLTSAASVAGASVATPALGTVEVLIVDKKRHLSITKVFSGLSPSSTVLAALTPAIGALLRLPVTSNLTCFRLSRTPVRMAKLLALNTTVGDLASEIDMQPPLLYFRAENSLSCAFAERGEWSLLRTPNDDLLRVVEACLREALTNVEFLRVYPHVIALASLTTALVITSTRPADVAATVSAILGHVEIAAVAVEHFKSATQLIAEKYVEATQSIEAAQPRNVADGVQPLPCPPSLMELIDSTIGLLLPKSRATVAAGS